MKIILLFFFSFVFIHSYSKNATFIFEGLGANEAFYDSIEVTVNKTFIEKDGKPHKVKINKNQLDTIIVRNDDWSLDTILAKLKAGEIYRIVFNPCSTFEIIPKTKNEGLKLVRLISSNRNISKLYLNSFYCFIDSNQIWNQDTTEYFSNAASGFCPYAFTAFDMCSKEINDINNEEDALDCEGVNLYFSGREMYTLYYDYKTKKMTARFDGYYDEKMKIKIGKN